MRTLLQTIWQTWRSSVRLKFQSADITFSRYNRVQVYAQLMGAAYLHHLQTGAPMPDINDVAQLSEAAADVAVERELKLRSEA